MKIGLDDSDLVSKGQTNIILPWDTLKIILKTAQVQLPGPIYCIAGEFLGTGQYHVNLYWLIISEIGHCKKGVVCMSLVHSGQFKMS